MIDAPKELTDSQKILLEHINQRLDQLEKKLEGRSLVRLWVWFKKCLSFAHSEAGKIHLDE